MEADSKWFPMCLEFPEEAASLEQVSTPCLERSLQLIEAAFGAHNHMGSYLYMLNLPNLAYFLCMCVQCMCMHIHTCVYACMYVCARGLVHMCAHVCMCVCMPVLYGCRCVCMCVYVRFV